MHVHTHTLTQACSPASRQVHNTARRVGTHSPGQTRQQKPTCDSRERSSSPKQQAEGLPLGICCCLLLARGQCRAPEINSVTSQWPEQVTREHDLLEL